ncbi:MAG: aminotransferase class V-fold PLP-dependent enzyme [Cellulosilyticaceae bacterium]
MIYLDHAATSYHKPEEVIQAVCEVMRGTGSSGRGVHMAALGSSRIVHQTREKLSKFFGVGDASRVVFTSNATESLNIAIQGLLSEGDHCITTSLEHNSVLRPLYLMAERGVSVSLVPADDKGCIQVEDMEALIQDNTKAIVVTHASNVLGNVLDIESIGKLCERHGLLFILDASQTAGFLTIDMEKLGVSALCFSGHKSLLGPQGVGVLCLGEGIRPRPLKAGGTGTDTFSKTMDLPLPTGLEAGTLNTHGIAGLGAAVDYINAYGMERIREEATALAKRFVAGVQDLAGVRLYGDLEEEVRTPVVSLNLRDIDAAELADELAYTFQIATRAGAHCAPEVHRHFGTMAGGMVRFSFSHFNTVEEVDQAIAAMRQLEEETR